MKSIHKIIVLFICPLAVLLQGCASSEEVIGNLRAKTDRALCMEYMTLPSANFYHSEREFVIRERRLDCWKYGNIAEERRRADAEFAKPLPSQREQVAPQQVIIQQQSNPNACIQDGGSVFCPNHPNTRSTTPLYRPVFK